MKHVLSSTFRLLSIAAVAALAIAASDTRADPRVRVGVSIGVPLPHGSLEVRVGRDRYFAHRGVFYRHGTHGYVVCPAPRGAVLRALPPHHVRVHVGPSVFYRYGNVYYSPVRGGYRVVDAPAIRLPATVSIADEDYQAIQVGEQAYEFKDGQFFRRTQDGLVWVEAPLGAVTPRLPADARSIWYEETEYFDCDGAYFRKVPNGYRVVEAPWKR